MSPTDTLIEIPDAHITLIRVDEVWHWRGPPGMTRDRVVVVLAAEVGRLGLKHGLLDAALRDLMSQR